MNDVIDGEALLQAVVDAPDDDDVRLVYADWLDDQGSHTRAEFVRVQTEIWQRYRDFGSDAVALLQRSTYAPDDQAGCRCSWCELRRRERDLLVKLYGGGDWFVDTVAMAIENGSCICTLRRGFVYRVQTYLTSFEELARPIFAANPVVRVELLDRAPVLDAYTAGWAGDTTGLSRSSDDAYPKQATLPRWLFSEMSGTPGTQHPESGLLLCRHYESPKSALDDLSQTLVALGRSWSGRPVRTV